MKYKIIHDEKTCINCGVCVSLCPDNWEMKNGKVKPKKTIIDEKELECNQKAMDSCPTQSIKIEKIK